MASNITDGFDPGDDEKVIEILKKWKGGLISDQLFNLIAGMMPTTGVVVVIASNKEDPEVIFVPRPEGDPRWSGKLNLPGKLFRNVDFKRSDNIPANGPLERIQKSEIGIEFPSNPKFIGINLNSDSRGSWAILVYLVNLDDKTLYKGVGEWVRVSEVEKRNDLINTEINHINVALGKVKSVS